MLVLLQFTSHSHHPKHGRARHNDRERHRGTKRALQSSPPLLRPVKRSTAERVINGAIVVGFADTELGGAAGCESNHEIDARPIGAELGAKGDHHRQLAAPPPSEESAKRPVIERTCGICRKIFESRNAMMIHVRTRHPTGHGRGGGQGAKARRKAMRAVGAMLSGPPSLSRVEIL